MISLYDFYIKNKKMKKSEEKHAPHLKNFFIYPVDGKNYIKKDYGFITYTETDKQTLNLINTIFKYYEEKNKFEDITYSGERTQGDFKIKIQKKLANNAKFSLYYKEKPIGLREVEFNPIESYLKLGIFTISGTSNIFSYHFVGKGLGRFLFETIDSVIPYQQIPQGYAGARGSLNENSERFWNFRRLKQVVPDFSNSQKKKNAELEKAFNMSSSDASLLLFAEYLDIQFSDYMRNKKTNKLYHKKFFPENIDDENFEECDFEKEKNILIDKIISLSQNDSSLYSSDGPYYRTFNSFRDKFMKHKAVAKILSSNRWSEDFLESNLKEKYNKKYPYYPYPNDITLIDRISDNHTDSRFFYKQNGEKYDIGIIDILNYPNSKKLTCSKILETVSKEKLKESIENVIKHPFDNDYISIQKTEIRYLNNNPKFKEECLSKNFFSHDENFFYFGNIEFSHSISKKEMIEQLSSCEKKFSEEQPYLTSSYGNYQSNLSEKEKNIILNANNNNLSMK